MELEANTPGRLCKTNVHDPKLQIMCPIERFKTSLEM